MENKLKIVTYNIHHGLKAEAITGNILDLAAKGVGVFCLQEIRKNEGEEFLLEALQKNLGPKWKADHFIKPGSNDLGLCILWDGSILKAEGFETILLPKLPKLYFYERALEKIQRQYPRPVQRAALMGKFTLDGQLLRIINVHLDWQGGAKQRALQLKALHAYLATKPSVEKEILCGDFNTIGFYRFYKRRFKKVSAIVGQHFKTELHKKPTTSYLETLDHIFVKNLNILKTEIIRCKGSDHFPLLAEIKI